MDNKDKTLQEQEAPLKNHDDAFVQVGHNGEPVIPKETEKEEQQNSTSEHDGVHRKS